MRLASSSPVSSSSFTCSLFWLFQQAHEPQRALDKDSHWKTIEKKHRNIQKNLENHGKPWKTMEKTWKTMEKTWNPIKHHRKSMDLSSAPQLHSLVLFWIAPRSSLLQAFTITSGLSFTPANKLLVSQLNLRCF